MKWDIYYRNTVMVHGIEAGALWHFESGKELILIDEDQHVTANYAIDRFKTIVGRFRKGKFEELKESRNKRR